MVKAERKDQMKDAGGSGEHTDWSRIWEAEEISRWDYLSQTILGELRSLTRGFRSKKVIELGSGTGRISKAISRDGGHVTLMDMAMDVLGRSREQFLKCGIGGNFIIGAFPNVPIKYGQFDIAWNAGVLEHFSKDEIKTALSEMARVCKKGGYVITINPYQRSVLHTVGTRFLIKKSVYPFKDEFPISTMKDLAVESGLELERAEYSFGFFLLFVGMFKRLGLFSSLRRVSLAIFWKISDMMCLIDRSPIGHVVRGMDRIFSKVFGGYLLVSIFSTK